MPTAVTDIQHGNEDGSITYIEAGEEVSGLPEEVMDDLRASGSITDEPSSDDVARLQQLEAEVEALRSQVATTGQTVMSRGGGSPLDMGFVTDASQLDAANEDVTGGESESAPTGSGSSAGVVTEE
jgi:hypothetical protein